MSITASHLRYALKRIADASSHPSALAYKSQLVGAAQKYLQRESENGGINLPPPSADILDNGSVSKEPCVVQVKPSSGIICIIEGKRVMVELQRKENDVRHVTSRRFMGLTTLDSIMGFL